MPAYMNIVDCGFVGFLANPIRPLGSRITWRPIASCGTVVMWRPSLTTAPGVNVITLLDTLAGSHVDRLN